MRSLENWNGKPRPWTQTTNFQNGVFPALPDLERFNYSQPGGEKGAVRAYSTKDGKLAWKSDLSGKGVYISSSILNLLGEDHLLAAVEGKIAGLNPKTEKPYGKNPGKSFLTMPKLPNPLPCQKTHFFLPQAMEKGLSVGIFQNERMENILLKQIGSPKT